MVVMIKQILIEPGPLFYGKNLPKISLCEPHFVCVQQLYEINVDTSNCNKKTTYTFIIYTRTFVVSDRDSTV